MPALTPVTPEAGWESLTAVQRAVFKACCQRSRESFSPITTTAWFHAEPPFRGSYESFAAHCRKLVQAGLLCKHGSQAAWTLTLLGEAVRDLIEAQS